MAAVSLVEAVEAAEEEGWVERRWCPETWEWLSLEEVRERFGKGRRGSSNRYGEAELESYWRWSMQRAGGTDPWPREDPDAEVPAPLKRLRLPHGSVRRWRYGHCLQGRYLLLKPPGFEECENSWPVLVFLHGHREIDSPTSVAALFSGRDTIFDSFALDNFVIIAPLAERGSALLDEGGHDFDIDALKAVLAEATWRLWRKADNNRLCVTGFSMGADAAATLAAEDGSHLAAVALFAGSYRDLHEQGMTGFRTVAARCFHNEADSYVSVESTNGLMRAIGAVCGDRRPIVREISIMYPNNVLSFEGQMSSKAFLQIRITEYDGGTKSSWELKDAVHLSDAHVCWPIIYANESSFGLFHWMLSCSASHTPEPASEKRKRLDAKDASAILGELKEAYSASAFRNVVTSLSAKAGRDKFLFLAHCQRLAYEVQRGLLRKWGFKQNSKGVVDLNASLADHLSSAADPGSSRSFQAEWDDVRRTLYGNMYHDCWLPSSERGDEPVWPLPQDAVRAARGLGAPLDTGQVTALAEEYRNSIEKEKQQKAISAASRRIPLLSFEACLDMQAELRDGFAEPQFQKQLEAIHKDCSHQPLKLGLLRADLVFEVQSRVLEKFGFEQSQRGVNDMLIWFNNFNTDPEFQAVSDECNYLLGIPHRFRNSAPEQLDTSKRAEAVKEWFTTPEGLAWLDEELKQRMRSRRKV